MSADTELKPEDVTESAPPARPQISACTSCPEKVVFIESDNTDGWIATDTTVPVDQ